MWHESPRIWPPTKEGVYAATKWLIRGTVIAWIIWDIVVFATVGHDATISHAMWEWSLAYPWFSITVVVVLCILCWHFFIPNAVGELLRDDPNWAAREGLHGNGDGTDVE